MLDQASRTFARRGYRAASMDEIADGAGVTKPMLYSYFGSKEGLFLAVAGEAAHGLAERVRAAGLAPDASPDERLWRGILAVFEFVEEHRDAWQILYPEGEIPSGEIGAGSHRARAGMSKVMAELLARNADARGIGEQATQHTDALAHIFTSATIAATSWWLDHPDEPKELHALRLMNFAWMGFGDLVEGRLWLPTP